MICIFPLYSYKEWQRTKEIFLYDVNLKSWVEAREKYGIQVENDLRNMSSAICKNVKKTATRDKSNRPAGYLKWIKRLTNGNLYTLIYICAEMVFFIVYSL